MAGNGCRLPTSAALPEGFQLEAEPSTGGALPAGFELETEPQAGIPDDLPARVERVLAYNPSEARARIQRQLNERLAAADEAGRNLSRTEKLVNIARPFLRGAVDLADGVTALPRLVLSAPVAAINAVDGNNLPLPISSSVADVAPGAREALAPRDGAERLTSTITQGLGGVLGGAGIGGALSGSAGNVAAGVGRTLAANPGLQTAGAVTAGLASERAREAGLGPVGQAIAGVAGGAAPSLLAAGGQAAVRGIFRGGETGRQTVERNVQTFERAGTTPTVGQATESRLNRAAETLLSRAPGGAGKIASKAESLADDIANNIEAKAARLAGKTSAEQTGRRISSAVTGSGGFVERFRAQQKALYDELDRNLPDTTPVSVANTQAALAQLTRITPGAARTSASLVNPRISRIAQDLAADAAGGTVPYSAVKELRTAIGREIDSGIVSDVPAAQWKQLYAGLSQDMRAAAQQAGPKATAAFNRANNYTKAGMQRLEVLDDVVQKNGGGEAIFKAAVSGTSDGATKLRAVMQSLDDQGQRAVSATVLRRLGRAINSQQDDVTDKFSTETFLTNWAKLSPEARKTLFSRFGDQYAKDIDAIAKVASNLRQGSKVYANPSGTGQATAQAATVAALVTSAITGDAGTFAAVGSTIAGSNMLARLMTNPKFVRWLAVSTKIPASAYTSQINGLAQMADRNKDQELFEAVELLKEAQNQKADPAKNEGKRNDR